MCDDDDDAGTTGEPTVDAQTALNHLGLCFRTNVPPFSPLTDRPTDRPFCSPNRALRSRLVRGPPP